VFVYHATGGLFRFFRPTESTYTTWNSSDPFPADNTIAKYYPSATLDATGRPVVAFFRAGSSSLGFGSANLPDGSAFTDVQEADNTGGFEGLHPSIAFINGRVCISYYDETNTGLCFTSFY
jgi:hypothetical protein